MSKPFRIGVVAPASRFLQEAKPKAEAIAAARPGRPVELVFHPQCFLEDGHFAGSDDARQDAVVEVGNDPAIDAVWFAHGGYGSNRVAGPAVARLDASALNKPWLGYSDMGFILAALDRAGACRIAHGPLVRDALRDDGSAARRALDWLIDGDPGACEPAALEARSVAFNLSVLSNLIGTDLEPDFEGRVLMIEEIAEHLYAIDRMLFHVTSQPSVRKAAGLRLGRCTVIPDNDPPFGRTEEDIARHWCAVSGIPYLGRADIGHDAANKVVPFS